jgi:hypothetical protein
MADVEDARKSGNNGLASSATAHENQGRLFLHEMMHLETVAKDPKGSSTTPIPKTSRERKK